MSSAFGTGQSPSQGWILRPRERDRVTVRILDHDRVDASIARRLDPADEPRCAELLGELVDVAHDQGARSLTGTFGQLVDLETSAAFVLPFDDFCHRMTSRAEELFVPGR